MLYGPNAYGSVAYGGLVPFPIDVVVAASIVEAAIATSAASSASRPSSNPADSGFTLLYPGQQAAVLSPASVAVSVQDIAIAISFLSIQEQQALVDAIGKSIDVLSGLVYSLPGQTSTNVTGISAVIASAFCSAIIAQASSSASTATSTVAATSPDAASYQAQVSAISTLIQGVINGTAGLATPTSIATSTKELLTQVSGIILPSLPPAYPAAGSATGSVSPSSPYGLTQQTAIEAISGALGAGFSVLAAFPSPGLSGASPAALAGLANAISVAALATSTSTSPAPLLIGTSTLEARTLVLALIQAIMGSIAAVAPAYSASPGLAASSRPGILTSARALNPAAGPAITPAAAATGLLLATFAGAAPGPGKASPLVPGTAIAAGLPPGASAVASSVASLIAALGVLARGATGKATDMFASASAAGGIIGLGPSSVSLVPSSSGVDTVLVSLGPHGVIAFRPLTYLVVEVIDARLGYFKTIKSEIGLAHTASMAVRQGFLLGCELSMASIKAASLKTAGAIMPVLTED